MRPEISDAVCDVDKQAVNAKCGSRHEGITAIVGEWRAKEVTYSGASSAAGGTTIQCEEGKRNNLTLRLNMETNTKDILECVVRRPSVGTRYW